MEKNFMLFRLTNGYTLSQRFTNAQIIITDISGTILKTAYVFGQGKGKLNIGAAMLISGAYNYSLIFNGKLAGTKQMILAK